MRRKRRNGLSCSNAFSPIHQRAKLLFILPDPGIAVSVTSFNPPERESSSFPFLNHIWTSFYHCAHHPSQHYLLVFLTAPLTVNSFEEGEGTCMSSLSFYHNHSIWDTEGALSSWLNTIERDLVLLMGKAVLL